MAKKKPSSYEVYMQDKAQGLDVLEMTEEEYVAQRDLLKADVREMKEKEILQQVSYDQWTPDFMKGVITRVQNQAYVKEMMVDMREFVRSKIDDNSDQLYGAHPAFAEFHKQKIGAGSASRFLFFTINIKPESQGDFGNIADKVQTAVNKVWVKRWLLSYEQRGLIGTDKFGTGLHLNLLVEKRDEYIKKKPSECDKEMKNTFKHLCQVHIPGVFHMSHAPVPDNFINYIRGKKADENKTDLVKADIQWRASLGIPDEIGTWNDYQ